MTQETLTVEQFRNLAERQKSGSGKRKNKYNARRYNGYDSEREYRRAQKLKLLQNAGLISELREQVKYVLIPAQRNADGRLLERECSYYADFVYSKDGSTIVEDTKGVRTPEYIIKRKLMLMVHGITIKEI